MSESLRGKSPLPAIVGRGSRWKWPGKYGQHVARDDHRNKWVAFPWQRLQVRGLDRCVAHATRSGFCPAKMFHLCSRKNTKGFTTLTASSTLITLNSGCSMFCQSCMSLSLLIYFFCLPGKPLFFCENQTWIERIREDLTFHSILTPFLKGFFPHFFLCVLRPFS